MADEQLATMWQSLVNKVANDEKLAEIAIAMARRMREKHCTTIPRRDSVYLNDVIYSSPSLSSLSDILHRSTLYS